jgi:hypothetical protein
MSKEKNPCEFFMCHDCSECDADTPYALLKWVLNKVSDYENMDTYGDGYKVAEKIYNRLKGIQ